MTSFELDPRLARDTIFLGRLSLCELRLMNDQRWPWVVLVPLRENAVDIHALAQSDQDLLSRETSLVASTLMRLTNCEKINSAALGNIVRQLHVHVVARSAGDPNWPGPVWGFGERTPYGQEARHLLIKRLKAAFFP